MKLITRCIARRVVLGLVCLLLIACPVWAQQEQPPPRESRYLTLEVKSTTNVLLAAAGMLVAIMVIAFKKPKRSATPE